MVANLQNTIYNSVATVMANPETAGLGRRRPDRRACSPRPSSTCPGCHSSLVVGMIAGVKLVIPEGRFDPDSALQLIQDDGVTIWATVPTMVWRVCEHPARHDYDTSTVTAVAFGGSPSADELQRKVRDTFPNVTSTSNAYGLTESSSVATVISGQDAVERPDSVGPAVPVVDLAIVDADGNEVPEGQTGEVLIKGPIIMPGYWNKPEATAETVDRRLAAHRRHRLPRRGRVPVHHRPGQGHDHPRAARTSTASRSSSAWSSTPTSPTPPSSASPTTSWARRSRPSSRCSPAASVTEEDVKAWVAETLANFKVPAYVELTDDKLPRNASGKLLKNVLRGEGEVSFSETM